VLGNKCNIAIYPRPAGLPSVQYAPTPFDVVCKAFLHQDRPDPNYVGKTYIVDDVMFIEEVVRQSLDRGMRGELVCACAKMHQSAFRCAMLKLVLLSNSNVELPFVVYIYYLTDEEKAVTCPKSWPFYFCILDYLFESASELQFANSFC
jgi:hypothetical protein